MTTFTARVARHRWCDGANLMLGVWLALSPTILPYMRDVSAVLNATLVGTAIAVMATAALVTFRKRKEWINVALAVWLIVSPFMLDYFADAMWNQVLSGAVIGGLALWTAATSHKGSPATD